MIITLIYVLQVYFSTCKQKYVHIYIHAKHPHKHFPSKYILLLNFFVNYFISINSINNFRDISLEEIFFFLNIFFFFPILPHKIMQRNKGCLSPQIGLPLQAKRSQQTPLVNLEVLSQAPFLTYRRSCQENGRERMTVISFHQSKQIIYRHYMCSQQAIQMACTFWRLNSDHPYQIHFYLFISFWLL